ncbi:hypothetical protein Hamer_G008208 [Homarus americanus]|uniref:Uncharacterized protein n=1 Tax=Homarus americanus TaxID=6706 RepID=A0A8J5TMH6_HOMAM|nr:hypothetical protein Hamer_G008208 [Homarus americanus]
MTSEDPYYNRRVKGTELRRFRHRFALGILALSGLIGTGIHYMPHSQAAAQKIKDGALKDSEVVEDHRELMGRSLTQSSETIRKNKQKQEDRPV